MQDATHHCGTFPHGEMGMKDPTQNDKPPIPFASRYSGVITVTPGSIPRPWGLSNVPVLTMSQFGPQAPRNENGVPSKPSSSVSEKTEHGMGKRDGSRGDQGNTVEQASALCYVPRSLDGFVSPQSLPHYHTEAIGMHVTHFPRPGPKPTHQYFGLPLMSMGPVNTPAPMHGPGMCCASLSPNTGGVTYDCPDSTFIYSTICQYQRMNQQLRESLSAARGEIEQLHQQIQQCENERERHEPKQTRRYWSQEEHNRFLEALKKFGQKDVRAIANYVGTRNPAQVRTHAQKYFLRIQKEQRKGLAKRSMSDGDLLRVGNVGNSRQQGERKTQVLEEVKVEEHHLPTVPEVTNKCTDTSEVPRPRDPGSLRTPEKSVD
mmetsp:Transcript_3695/g.7074  ORF Transcript_3695/g.7074 Transcript_3695/m.7074 type:complete len:375 (-) Transcript_3695:367-1491(-)